MGISIGYPDGVDHRSNGHRGPPASGHKALTMNQFKDLHVVVTGGTGALGSAVVQKIVAEGGICHVPCVDAHELEHFALAGHDHVRLTMGGELRSESVVTSFYENLPSLWASIHCAGGFAMSAFTQTPLAGFLEMFDTNAVSCFLCCREAVKKLRTMPPGAAHDSQSAGGGTRPGRGRIVNVTARPALEARLGAMMSAYTVSKAAVAALTQAVAEEVVGDEILVNAVVPSIMDTRANRRAMPQADHSKWVTLDEVASTIVFLASPENTSTRGGLVPVYGKS